MKLGAIHLWGDSLELFLDRVRLSDRLGYDLIGVGDVPPGYHDPYMALAMAAPEVSQALIGPMITGPQLRHPVANVHAMSALHDLTAGRAVLGLGAGNSIALGLGQKQPPQIYIRDYILALRGLFAGQSVHWNGATIEPMRYAREVAVIYSASGPKALRIAGQAADGVLLMVGSSIEAVRNAVRIVKAAALEAGRDLEKMTFWAYGVVSVGATREEALHKIRAYLAVGAPALAFRPRALDRVPSHLRPRIDELRRRYDLTEHALGTGKNGALAEELDLLEYLSHGRTIAGTSAEVTEYLDTLAAEGISLLMSPFGGQTDVAAGLRDLIACRPAASSN